MKTLFSIIAFLFLGVTQASAQVTISITQPSSGAQVQMLNNTIRVTTSPALPVGQCIVVFVQDPNGNWWPNINVNPNTSRTQWEVTGVQFGAAPDKNNTFNIQAVIMNSNIRTQGLGIQRNIDGGSYSTENYNLINSNHSSIIGVIRK